jgi:catechol 2,3-dioxygenase-like lactoylglutathione lyase family enzyme
MIIDHIAIRAEDIKKSAEWYKEKLGAKVTYLDDYYIRLTTHNSTIAIIDKNKYPHEHIGVLVDSIEDLPSDGTRANHRDGTVSVFCEGPEGKYIEFIYYSEELRSKFVTYAYSKND